MYNVKYWLPLQTPVELHDLLLCIKKHRWISTEVNT